MGENTTISASGCAGTLSWSTGSSASSITVSPNVTTTYAATCTVAGCVSNAASISITVNTSPNVTLTGPSSATQGQTIVLTLTLNSGTTPWNCILSTGKSKTNISSLSDTAKVVIQSTTTYTISQVSNICGNGTGNGSVNVTVNNSQQKTTLDITAILEGAYNTSNQSMRTTLNQRGLLPGQTPIGSSATPTPAGQPYNKIPWNYTKGENVNTYSPDAVDWVLVSLRTTAAAQDTIWRGAGIIKSNGKIEFPDFNLLPTLANNSSYYICVEHRNHLGVLSHVPISVINNILTYNFTTQNSFTQTAITSYGQKQIGTVFAMYSSDGVKNPANQNYDININELNLWKLDNGLFDTYLSSDFNLDAEVNYLDRAVFKLNNGIFSMIGL